MKRAFKALLLIISIFFVSALSVADIKAQNNLHPEYEGTWVLDSVQVKEVMPDSIVVRTVLPGGESKFNNSWMLQFTLNANGKASYSGKNKRTISDRPYSIEGKTGNIATLIINGIIDHKKLNTQLISAKSMLISNSFTTGYKMKDIEVSWKMYYRKSE
jgi:hypothetical protein